jgi:hypothetical protein
MHDRGAKPPDCLPHGGAEAHHAEMADQRQEGAEPVLVGCHLARRGHVVTAGGAEHVDAERGKFGLEGRLAGWGFGEGKYLDGIAAPQQARRRCQHLPLAAATRQGRGDHQHMFGSTAKGWHVAQSPITGRWSRADFGKSSGPSGSLSQWLRTRAAMVQEGLTELTA